MEPDAQGQEAARGPRRLVGLVLGPALLAVALATAPPGGLSPVAWRAAGVGLWMAVWWVTEAVPIPATALLPLAVFPLLGVADMGDAASPYANPLIFLFLGGFLLALGMQRWGLPRRMALAVVALVGPRPRSVVAGFMLSAALLSMWVSNTATAMIMLPIGVSVLELVRRREGESGTGEEATAGSVETGAAAGAGPASGDDGHPAGDAADLHRGGPAATRTDGPGRNFGLALMLGIAYGCSVGGLATLVGTPPNAFLAAFFSETFGVEVGFAQWMAFGLPLAAVGLPVVYLVLVRVAFPVRLASLPGGRELIRRERERLGPLSRPERRVAAVFAAVAGLWVFRPLVADWVPGLTDAGIAVAGGLALFLLPAGAPPAGVESGGGIQNTQDGDGGGARDRAGGGSGQEAARAGGAGAASRNARDPGAAAWTPLLRWRDAERLPWGVLILFGGGLSLASALQETGFAGWLGETTSGLAGHPLVLVVGGPVLLVVLLTELTSNTATTAAFLPVLASVAVGVGQDPRLLAVPAAVAASCAFMLPVATPPNAIVYGSGAVTVPEMARAGAVLNVVFAVLVTAAAWLLLPLVFGVEFGVVPPWAAG